MNTNNPPARDGESLNWIVVNPDGKLLAIVDSESEAYFFVKGRGHANGSVYFKSPFDYAAMPDLLKALESFLRAPSIGSNGPGSSTIVVQDFDMRDARAAIARATGDQVQPQADRNPPDTYDETLQGIIEDCETFLADESNIDPAELIEAIRRAARSIQTTNLAAALKECVTDPGAHAWNDGEAAYRRLRAINQTARHALRAAIAKAERQTNDARAERFDRDQYEYDTAAD